MKIAENERAFQAAVEGNRNMLVPWYLMASFAYYHDDDPILTDGTFDQICRRLDAEWDHVAHIHKSWVNRADVRAGTCLLKRKDFPSVTRHSVEALRRDRKPRYMSPPRDHTAELEQMMRDMRAEIDMLKGRIATLELARELA